MSKAAELAALIGSQTALSNRNFIINGAMTVAQRGDTTDITGESYGGPDRFKLRNGSQGTWSMTQSTTTPSGFGSSMKLDCTTADASPASSDRLFFVQRLEGQNLQNLDYGTSGAKKVTLSFYVRSNKTGTYVCELFNHDPSTNRHIGKTYTINSANTWELKTLTFGADTSQGFNNDANHSLEVIFYLGAGTNFTSGTLPATWADFANANRAAGQTVNLADSTDNEWLLTGVQLEIGEVATPFEHEDFGTTLAKCQRYFQLGNGVATGRADGGTMGGFGAFKEEMRGTPTITAVSQTGAHFSGTVSYASPSTIGTFITSTVNGTGNNAYAQVTFSADAEL